MAKVLIVDDDEDIVEAMKVVLESKKYVVITAKSGDEGIQKVKLAKPHLIILDIMMETGDKGFQVCKYLKKEPNYRDIPILMLTAVKERTGFDFKEEAGDKTWLPVDDYADKPLQPDELLAKVECLLRKGK